MLSQKKLEVRDRDFFKHPFTREEIENLLQGRPPSEMFNFRSPRFKKIGADKDSLGDEALIGLKLQEPRLIRRPVVRIGRKVFFGADSRFLGEMLK